MENKFAGLPYNEQPFAGKAEERLKKPLNVKCDECDNDDGRCGGCHLTALDYELNIIPALVAEAVASEREKWIDELQAYQSVHRIKDDDVYMDGDYIIMPLEQWQHFKEGKV